MARIFRGLSNKLIGIGEEESIPVDPRDVLRSLKKNTLLSFSGIILLQFYLYLFEYSLFQATKVLIFALYGLLTSSFILVSFHLPKLALSVTILGANLFFFFGSLYLGKESLFYLFLFNSGIFTLSLFYTKGRQAFLFSAFSCSLFFILYLSDFQAFGIKNLPLSLQEDLVLFIVIIQFILSFYVGRSIVAKVQKQKQMLNLHKKDALRLLEESEMLNDELQEARELESQIFNFSHDAKFLEDHEKNIIINCNQRALEIFKFKEKSEIVGKRGRVLHAEELDETKIHLIHRSIYQTGKYFGEFRYRKKDGTTFWGSMKLTLIQASGITYRLSSVEDISLVKGAREAIEKRERQLQMAMKIGRIGTFQFDTKKNVLHLSKELMQILRLDHHEITKDFQSYIHNDDLEKLGDEIEKLITHGKPFHSDIKLIGKGNQIIHAAARAEVIRDSKWQIIEVIGTIQDISQRKIREELLKHRNKELKKINAELDSFVYSAAHDLRAPIVNVMGLVGLIKAEEDIGTIHSYAEHQYNAMVRLDTFIKDIIDYSRNNRLVIKAEPVDLTALLQAVFEDYSFIEHADRIDKRIEIEVQGSFYQDKGRLKMIFNNLLSNAIRYSDPTKTHPYVLCKGNINKAGLELIIEDNGQGIREDRISKIFEMFYRGNDQSKGSGIGLYITIEAIKKLGGSISVESVYGKGTSFHILIPNLPHRAQSPAPQTALKN